MELSEEIKKVESWMTDLSAALKVELHLDEEGICSFKIGEETVVTVEVSQDFPMVNIYSTLVTFPEDMDQATLMMAHSLELNAFQSLTRGGAIAAVPGEGILIFCYTTPTEGNNSETFSRILGGFIETVAELKEILTNELSKNQNANIVAPSPKTPFMMFKG